jgi:glyoxylase I family protein
LEVLQEIYREERDLQTRFSFEWKLHRRTVSLPNPPKRPSRPESCGLRHLAFEVKCGTNTFFLTQNNIPSEDIRWMNTLKTIFLYC